MNKIIVTGGSGFFGTNLIRYLLDTYKDKIIINYDKSTYDSNPIYMKDLEENPNYKFISGDINNKLLFQETIGNNTEIVYHLAASTHVDKSFMCVEEFIRNNILGTVSLLEIIRYLKKKPLFIYMGTDEIFGDAPLGVYYKEDSRFYPQNPYSASKASAEMYCRSYSECFKVPVVFVRSMNMFGPYQHPEKLIAKIITKALSEESFTLYKGESIRGWIYVGDSSNAMDVIATKGNVGEIYHIPPATYKSVPDIVNLILKLMNKEYLFKGFSGYRLKDDFRYALDGNKMRYELNWKPKETLANGIKKTIQWYKNNESYWKSILNF